MTRYALISGGLVVASVEQSSAPTTPGTWVASNAGPGSTHSGNTFTAPTAVDPCEWLIDIGDFLDRFGASKMPLLISSNAIVQALVKDVQSRKWVDLRRADVATGIDALIALGIDGVDENLKDEILNTPVSPAENAALRAAYFRRSG